MKWSERNIAGAIARQTFSRACVVVNNCNWTGYECDLLVVTSNLRLVDVEVKISRADLKADAKKDKWWHRGGSWRAWAGETAPEPTPREWPPKVWKHYYALPAAIWTDELAEGLPKASGILLLHESDVMRGGVRVDSWRRCTPNKDAQPIGAAHAVDIARLASLRMWDAFDALAAIERAKVAV